MKVNNDFWKSIAEFNEHLRSCKNISALTFKELLDAPENKYDKLINNTFTKEDMLKSILSSITTDLNNMLSLFDKILVTIDRKPIYEKFLKEFNQQQGVDSK